MAEQLKGSMGSHKDFSEPAGNRATGHAHISELFKYGLAADKTNFAEQTHYVERPEFNRYRV